ncbi:MAG: hypothetical protein R2849_19270 [Thermomicrobiales bacterium]
MLTFYEHRLGVLPLNANFATIMPKAAFNDQRATRLTFESPQTFETFEVDLRYPTSSRGGFLVGFEEFFAENLVPGAVVTIEATRDRETHFIIEYFQISRQDRKLLQFNERRNTFIFQSTTYFCATQDGMLIDDNHLSALPMSNQWMRNRCGTWTRSSARRSSASGHVRKRTATSTIEPILSMFWPPRTSSVRFPSHIFGTSCWAGRIRNSRPTNPEEDVFIYVAPAS